LRRLRRNDQLVLRRVGLHDDCLQCDQRLSIRKRLLRAWGQKAPGLGPWAEGLRGGLGMRNDNREPWQ
jgi:hypothetical protein